MDKKNRERLKRQALLAFLVVSVVLVGLVWADGLVEKAPATPSYYRDTFRPDENLYVTITAEAYEYQLRLTQTPEALREEEHGQGHGSGQGGGQGSGQEGGQGGDGH
ncbi:MAG: hypothetical protein H6667_21840 [Ardenticatenaceae bacterium]|nr:hypothetical protein [Ardenticatenaceae bacterium]